MKMYKKSILSLIDGMLVSPDGDIVGVDPAIVSQANKLETLFQQGKYLMAQPEATPAPSLDGFERKSAFDISESKFDVSTPVLDAKAEETMALMDELDDMATASKANDMIEEFRELISFAMADYVVDCGTPVCLRFDTPTIGSVLELTPKDVSNVVALVNGMVEEVPIHRVINAEDLDAEDVESLRDIISKHTGIDRDNVKVAGVDEE
jgi:hypothetical protein